MITLFNPGSTPVVYDEAGHVLGGVERVDVEALDAAGERAVEHGYLINEGEKEEEEPKGKPGRRSPRDRSKPAETPEHAEALAPVGVADESDGD